MKQNHAATILFALILASMMTSLGSYRMTARAVEADMDRALALTMAEQQDEVISPDTIRTFNSYLQIAALRGKATLAVDARGRQFRAYAHCPGATVLGLTDQRPSAVMWILTAAWAVFCLYGRHRQENVVPEESLNYGGLRYAEPERCFYDAQGQQVRLTPMQQQLMEMFFRSPGHQLSKTEICDALWPKKTDASETLYALISRLKPIVEQHSELKIESDRGRAYILKMK
jgi:hypothetical protein